MPPRLLPHPHERRNPHCPPSPSPAYRADRVDRRDHTEGGPHERVSSGASGRRDFARPEPNPEIFPGAQRLQDDPARCGCHEPGACRNHKK
eukprot:6275443-Prymnesium_polylepis.1